MKRKISILLPTRKRVPGLDRQIKSIEEKTNDLDRIELIACAENEDLQTIYYFNTEPPKMDWKLYITSPTIKYAEEKVNQIAKLAHGDILWLLADDTEIVTKDWDVILEDAVNKSGLEIYLVAVMDSNRELNPGDRFSIVPMLSRKAYETLGYFFDPRQYFWGVDKYLFELFKEVGKVVDIKDIFIKETKIEDENHEIIKKVYEEHGSGHDLDYSMPIKRLKSQL